MQRMVAILVLVLVAGCSSESDPLDETEEDTGSEDAEVGSGDAELDGNGGTDGDGDLGGEDAPDAPWPDEWEPDESTFQCISSGTPVERYFLWNVFGLEDEALAFANGESGEEFPPGTVIQLVPQEAMVKRLPGFNDATNDWEFFFLDVNTEGTVISARGVEEVENAFGGNCFSCHSPAAGNDFVCGTDNGCDPLPLSEDLIRQIQSSDPRCE